MLSAWKYLTALLCLCSARSQALDIGGQSFSISGKEKRDGLQELVTWDQHSLFVRGERIMFYSAEFHPFRLPVPGLWLDIFQKIKALGYNGVSFYVDWALHEGKSGEFSAEGVFAWEPFFEAATEAGIYLLARPGPYINAEVSGGGFPAWLQRVPAILRTNQTAFLDATEEYVAQIGRIIARAQITNGGPVILFQAENEYTYGVGWILFPDVAYIEYVNAQFRRAGIVVPFINNEAAPRGVFIPGEAGGPDIYGHDNYPLGFDCSRPTYWRTGALPTNFRQLHLEQSPNTAYSLVEFQGGSYDNWGGVGGDACAAMVNHEFERVVYKNNLAAAVTIFNIYMTYGGTNWGNLGRALSYTSYDYGAAIRENRQVDREKYSEAKLEAVFATTSPAYLTARPGNATNSSYVSTAELTTTPLWGQDRTNLYVVRHSAYGSTASTAYTFTVPTSAGKVTIPQLGDTSLTLNGRDSKVHVTDYDVGGINLVYSSADIFTHASTAQKRVLLLYGDEGETHELAFSSDLGEPRVEGGGGGGGDGGGSDEVKIERRASTVVVQWTVTPARKVLHYADDALDVYLLWRNDAYKYWSLELAAAAPVGNYTSPSKQRLIAKAGYLLRSAAVSGTSLYLSGDLNATSELEIVAGFSASANSRIYFNDAKVSDVKSANGRLSATLSFAPPAIRLPELAALQWKHIDTVPERFPSYDDAAWVVADHATTNNTLRNNGGELFSLRTPTSLLSSDYGFHTGSLLYRGHFVAQGNESDLYLSTQGGGVFGQSVWLDDSHLASYGGGNSSHNATLPLPRLRPGSSHLLTVLLDHLGQEENWTPGYDAMKTPRGILDFRLGRRPQSAVVWKLTGNLGGEDYRDRARGPLNEGGMWAERQGYHLPRPPSEDWETANPVTEGISRPGVGFYVSSFRLDVPAGWDVPLSFVFANTTTETAGGTRSLKYRVQLYVNGYQFGKYVNNIGPQRRFPVPEGILDHNGVNYVALTLWSHEDAGARLGSFTLEADAVIQSAYRKPALSPQPAWTLREGAY